MIKRILTGVLTGTAVVLSAAGYDIQVTPGSLESALEGIGTDTSLTLSGTADARDLEALGRLPATVRRLDMSGLRIVELRAGEPLASGRSYFMAGEIPEFTFFRSGLTEITLPSDVTIIGRGAFARSAVTSMTLPKGVRSIGDYAFYGCAGLRSISMPQTLTAMGTGAFGNCTSLKTFDLSTTRVAVLEEGTLAGCSALSSFIPGSALTAIGSKALAGTSVMVLELSGVTRLDDYALAGMSSLIRVSFPSDASLGTGVLMDDTSLVHVTASPAQIPSLFAANCTLLSPSTLMAAAEEIGEYALANPGTEGLVFGPDLYSIAGGAFHNASRLEYINAQALGSAIPAVEDDSFTQIIPADITLLVAENTEDAWLADPFWSRFKITTDISTVSDMVSETASITIVPEGRHLVITAPEALTSVRIYSLSGSCLGQWNPGTTSARLPVDGLEKGTVIVMAETSERSHSVRIMLH